MAAQIPSRWAGFGTSIFTTMTEASVQADAINLSQGFPDFDGPPEIKEAAIAAIREGRNQYAPAAGLPPLRAVLAEAARRHSGLTWDPLTETTVFSGATEALFCSILALCEPGDELVTFEPCYDSYAPAVMAAGATLKTVVLRGPDWTFDEDDLRRAVSPRTKALLLNTPNNPTGKVFGRAELEMVARLAHQHGFFVITDEVYEHLVYDGGRHLSLATLPGMRERTVTISSTSKTFSMTGWKIGFAFAPPSLTAALRAVHQFVVFCSATPLQWGMAATGGLGDDYLTRFREEYQERRDFLHGVLVEAGFRCRRPQGTYFIVGEYEGLSPLDDLDFCLWLTREVGVSAIPVSAFCTETGRTRLGGRFIRFAFCKGLPTLQAAADRLRRARFPGS
ncbi:MAG: aminotransferase class I/II-fold pyridoxal phosphate-dependent enzyme [Candidatus Riflebacteria bacterium]|nr:aminotransferase class I/II-fold pyridoxal phosphate-dependent enzyme [Candidatus Riflebacteria bacterium]